MPNLSQLKRERMLAFLQKIKDEHRDDDDMLIALGEIESELTSKKYGLVWEQHEEAVDVMMRDNIPVFTEVPEREITAAPGQDYNFILEGDNLHSLYLLSRTHREKIDIIYIDPPYNTGKKNDEQSSGFIYDDQFVDDKDAFIHSKWLSFMKERLMIAKTLLAPDGVIFISIGKEENAPLRMLCDELFGEKNLLGQLVRRTKTTSFRGNYFALRLDYVLCYCTGKKAPSKFMDVVDECKYKKIETEGKYAGERYKDDTAFYLSTLETRPNQRYFVKCPDGELVIPPGTTVPAIFSDAEKCIPANGDGVWRWEVEQYRAKKHYLSFKKTKTSPLLNQNGQKAHWNIYTKSYYCEKVNDGNIPTELMLDFINRNGSKEIKALGLDFSFPKPSELIKYLIKITNKPQNITILDFFAGSGTTAHAVLELNASDNGTRQFILCTNNEKQICEKVTYPRVKTVITGKRLDGRKYSNGIPSNVKYYRTDFVAKDDEYLSDSLLEHTREMIQLEHGVKIDGSQYLVVMSDEDADELQAHWSKYEDVKAIYASKDVLFTTEQNKLFAGVEIHTIPDYYFNFELKEVGETW